MAEMLTPLTDANRAGDTRYNLLADNLAEAIRRGTLPAGSRLPSVRRSAQTYSVSINTVVAAYRRLEDRGLIEARPQSGFYVRTALPALEVQHLPHGPAAEPADDVLDLIDTVFAAQINPAYTNLSLACPQANDFYPGAKLGRIMSSLLRRQPHLIGQYALPPGNLPLRQQIARRSLALGMMLEASDITLTHGCMEALQLALRVTTQPGDSVGLETPTYFYLLPLLASLGLKAVEIPTDPQTGLSLDALELMLNEKRLNAVIAMPTAQNPMGFTMPLAAKKRLARLMNDHRVPLIEDGLYAEIQFSDALSPAVGWIAGGRFADKLRKLKAVSSMTESSLLSQTLAVFLESGGYDHHLRSLRRRYEAQVDEARALIAQYFPQGTRSTRPMGGFVFWVDFPECAANRRRAVCRNPVQRRALSGGEIFRQVWLGAVLHQLHQDAGSRFSHWLDCGRALRRQAAQAEGGVIDDRVFFAVADAGGVPRVRRLRPSSAQSASPL